MKEGMNMKILLWEGEIPGFRKEFGQEEPWIIPYLVKGEAKRGAVVVCPGGGYTMKADHEGEPIALWLNSIGLSAFVLNYRVAPYQHPYPLMDVKRAIRTVRYHGEEWNIDPRRIGVLGFSAGGHLASTAGTLYDHGDPDAEDPIECMDSRPDAMVLCYPVITFGEFRHHGSMVNLIGEAPSDELRESLSSEKNVTENTPPTFLWHTADDAAVPVENSLMFASALSKCKVPFELHVFPHGRHGLGLAREEGLPVAAWTELCRNWFKTIGFIE